MRCGNSKMIRSTSGDSSRNIMKWVLVQWPTKKRDIVHMRSILCPTEKVEVGRYVNLHWAGRENTALVVALSHDREMLENMMKKRSKSPVPGPSWSRTMEEIDRDYSPSASSLKPSDDETTSLADSDEDIQEIRKRKIIDRKRRLLKRLSMENLVTPKHRSTPIKSRSESSINTLRRKNVKSQDGRINTGRTLATAVTFNQKYRILRREDYPDHINSLITSFECLINLYIEHIKNLSPNARLEESPEPPQNESPEAPQRHESSESSKSSEEDHEDDFDGSDVEVLITNKFSKVLNKEIHRMKPDKNVTHQTIEKSIKRITDKIKRSQAIVEFKDDEESENINTAVEPTDQPDKEWIGIGSGKTLVHKDKFKNVNWKSYTIATRSLLLAVFPRRILATHSLTGKKSPAFLHKPAKMSLDPQVVSDVVSEIMYKFRVEESLVRAIITTKCSDEAKMLKIRHDKSEDDLENIPPPANDDKNA
ncbi:unnamed protein product [Spodoptera littoralis]|uniref:BEN domain-containing protein n=1 Tax=Spodoptera littoralis TaxID=7109 RepID=A0A9P0I5F0_SPOLI|nr:unnamed protein product [Spodoptera littoralis]CAH1639228.1 unnamed protein product [Spodoptera littoralis]